MSDSSYSIAIKQKVRILAVTDQDELRGLAREAFGHSAKRFEFLEAKSGEEGVRAALKEKPDVVLMDMSLHSLSGIDAARQIKAQLPRSKVILFTMYLCDDSPAGF